MQYSLVNIDGAYLIKQRKVADERGYFSRNFSRDFIKTLNPKSDIMQCSESWNHKKGTIRGLHYQMFPYEEIKLIRCLKGKLFDVIVDLRKDSPSYLNCYSIVLTEFDGIQLYIPKGVAHGFQTLDNDTVIGYTMIEGEYNREAASGIRWNDASFSIDWPQDVSCISSRDANYPDFNK